MTNEELEQIKAKRDELMREATAVAYAYFAACDVGDERIAAGEIFDNLRNAGRVY
jgi:hypothetical protein